MTSSPRPGVSRSVLTGCCLAAVLTLSVAGWPAAASLQEPDLFQGHPQGPQLLEELQLGMQRVEEGRLEEAIGHFSKVLEAAPGHPLILIHRGRTRLRLGAFAAAEQDLEPVVASFPDLLPARRELAVVYLRQGKLTEAVETYTQIIDQKPGDLVARWNLRVAYARQGGYPGDLPERYRITLPPHGVGTSPVTFTDVAPQLGMAALSRARGSAWGDYDGDGDADLFAVSILEPHHLYRNDGDGTFTEVTEEAGLVDPRGGWASMFLDYDRDGDLDIFVTRDGWLGEGANSLYRNNGDGTFTDVAEAAGVSNGGIFLATLGDVDNDGWVDIYVTNGAPTAEGAPNVLYRNRGDGSFVDIASQAGVANHGRSIGCAFGDYDNDGWLDLFVINIDGPNALYRNNGDGTFADVTKQVGIEAPHDGFVGFFFDYDNDGWLDLFVTGWTDDMEEVLQSALSGTPSQERNRLALYHNNGDGTFTDVTTQAGLARTYGAMAAQYGDVDNDGYLDIYLGTGAPPMDTYEPNKLLWNTGMGTFLDVTESAGVGNLGKGHGATFSDYDNDGDLDLFAPIGGALAGDRQPNSFYRNNGTPHHWVKLRLIATTSNPDAIGARVQVTTELGNYYRAVATGTGLGSMNDPMIMVGLGAATRVEQVTIDWPSGVRQEFSDLAADQVIEITEGNATLRQTAR